MTVAGLVMPEPGAGMLALRAQLGERAELRHARRESARSAPALFAVGVSRHLENRTPVAFHQTDTEGDIARQGRRQEERRRLWAMRAVAAAVSHSPRLAKCGRCSVAAGVDVLQSGSSIRFGGVVQCGRIWTCAVCSARIARLRSAEVLHALTAHHAAGGGALLLTPTVRHGWGDRLAATQTLVADAWRKVQGGKGWGLLVRRFGLAGQIRALEVTHGRNGWHPHLHVLILTDALLSRDARRALHVALYDRWRSAVAALSGEDLAPYIGLCHLKAIRDGAADDVAEYVTKLGAACEVTRATSKHGRRGNRTSWDLLVDIGRRGVRAEASAHDRCLWHEWETAMHGRKALTWSRGLKERFGILDRDEAALFATDDASAAVLASVPADEWAVLARRPSMQLRALEYIEHHGVDRLPALWSRLRRLAPTHFRRMRAPPDG